MSKIGLNALTRILARELAPRVRVNAVCPGWVRTDMGGPGAGAKRRCRGDEADAGVRGGVWPQRRRDGAVHGGPPIGR